jgi:tripartite-type tricarboxylate transporter receptor subunit TctC
MKPTISIAALSAAVLTIASPHHAVAQTSAAQNWPERPVTMVVPFAAGGGTDLLGRIGGRRLSEVLGQQVIIENVAGAGGMVGSARVVKAAPDGYQMVVGTTADAINQTLYKAPLYNFATDLVPAGLMGNQPSVLLTRKDFPANDLKEFTAYAKANQSGLQMASAGTGSTGHLFCNMLNAALGITVTHVPYRGGGPAMQDLIAGRTDYICTLTPTAKPLMDGNLARPIALLSRERSPMLPDLPTAHEQGLTDFDTDTWFGLFFPKDTPEPIVRKLNAAIAVTLDSPYVQDRFKEIVASVTPPDRRSPEYLQKLVVTETAKMRDAIKAAGVAQN